MDVFWWLEIVIFTLNLHLSINLLCVERKEKKKEEKEKKSAIEDEWLALDFFMWVIKERKKDALVSYMFLVLSKVKSKHLSECIKWMNLLSRMRLVCMYVFCLLLVGCVQYGKPPPSPRMSWKSDGRKLISPKLFFFDKLIQEKQPSPNKVW